MKRRTSMVVGQLILSAAILPGTAALAAEAKLSGLTICADPGNMPLSNENREGFENKIAQVIGKTIGASIHYYWRPSIERGLMRTTLGEGNCDVWMDMATDTEGAAVLSPLYRSTFVLATRTDKNLHFKNLSDPQLKKLRVGVYQVSAMREALTNHGVQQNTVVQYMSHNADVVENSQPSYQVQQVATGELDVAAVWGPMAGYYKTIKKEPLTIQPANLMEDEVPLEFSMALAVPRNRPEIKAAVEGALRQSKDEIRQILVDYGVPLVKCDDCLISGDLPSHGPYKEPEPDPRTKVLAVQQAKSEQAARMAQMKAALANGGNANAELQNAIVASDVERVKYALAHGAKVDAKDGAGNTGLLNATRTGFNNVALALLDAKANPNLADLGNWTPLMYAAYFDNEVMVKALIAHGANINARDNDQFTPLAIAAQNGKSKSADALLAAGADANVSVAKGGYTPLMLSAIAGSDTLAHLLIKHGANVNAPNPGGVTALMIAAANEHPTLAELLLKSGANVDAKSDDGRTALSIAQGLDNATLVQMLQSAAQAHASKTT